MCPWENNKGENEATCTTTWDTNWYYMRKAQGTIKYESYMKQTPIYVLYKIKICRTWGIIVAIIIECILY